MILLSNLFAVFLQSLCIKLGSVTGLNLAEACRAFLPRWLNYILYVMAEVAIIATDIAEVRCQLLFNSFYPEQMACSCNLCIQDRVEAADRTTTL